MKNNLENEATTLHVHGMRQTGTGWMDGAPQVTQCSIQPGETFTYRLVGFVLNDSALLWLKVQRISSTSV